MVIKKKRKSLKELQREVLMKKVRNTSIVLWDVGPRREMVV